MSTVELPVWQLISIGVGLVGALMALLKLLVAAIERRLDQRFALMDGRFEELAKDSDRLRQVELGLEKLRGEMPLHYVRREDFVRNQTIIEAKLDSLALKLENVQLRGARQ
ncbi:hypothetical protein PF66_02264 [Pseudomonas asplenii]|uniref:Uncharacterized protein n=1 Tax=Pseudomonas asplenii TaxID=53407 RepID=A0A0M9GHH8_9PSED|nr:hypothetical protein [Pseudomonas fuscovaginae]KPA91381.1 hypothetical protein PF66_02264 [Pseudomonas fuscovaginae]